MNLWVGWTCAWLTHGATPTHRFNLGLSPLIIISNLVPIESFISVRIKWYPIGLNICSDICRYINIGIFTYGPMTECFIMDDTLYLAGKATLGGWSLHVAENISLRVRLCVCVWPLSRFLHLPSKILLDESFPPMSRSMQRNSTNSHVPKMM